MNDLRLPIPAPVVDLQSALTRTLDAAVAYGHAARISESRMLAGLCREVAEERMAQAGRIAEWIKESGGTPDTRASGEAGFQQLWMSLVSRRFPSFQEGLPRECERSERRLERVLLRLIRDHSLSIPVRRNLTSLLREVREGVARLQDLRSPDTGLVPMGAAPIGAAAR